jgi:hypothetical protein
MPSNQTSNYQLSQWERSDKIQMEDFNADNAKIDAALKAEADARTALAGTVSSQGSTLAGHTSALGKKGSCQLYTTAYDGVGGTSKSLSFPGYPVFVWVQDSSKNGVVMCRGAGCAAGSYGTGAAVLTWSSRGVSWKMYDGRAAVMDTINTRYSVMALLDMSK